MKTSTQMYIVAVILLVVFSWAKYTVYTNSQSNVVTEFEVETLPTKLKCSGNIKQFVEDYNTCKLGNIGPRECWVIARDKNCTRE